MFKTGLAGQMFDALPYREHLESAVSCGYDSVQLRSTHVKPDTPEAVVEDIAAFVREHRLAISGLSCFTGNYGLKNEAECLESFEDFKRYVALAVRLGAGMVRVWPGWQESASAPPEVWRRATDWMRRSAAFAADHGIRIGMEMHHGTLCDTFPATARLLEAIGHEQVGVMMDPVNLYQVPSDYGPESIATLGERIFDVHVKDIVRLTGNAFPYAFAYSYYATHIGRFTKVVPPAPAEERYYCHRRINQGGIDWSAVLQGLRQIDYQGALTVESVQETNRLMPGGRELAAACKQDLDGLMAAFEKAKPPSEKK